MKESHLKHTINFCGILIIDIDGENLPVSFTYKVSKEKTTQCQAKAPCS